MTGSILLVVQKSCHFASGQLILKGHVDSIIPENIIPNWSKLIWFDLIWTDLKQFGQILPDWNQGWGTLCIKEHFTSRNTLLLKSWTHFAAQHTLQSHNLLLSTLCIVTFCSKEQFASNWLVTVCSLTHFTPQHTLPTGIIFSLEHSASKPSLLPRTLFSSAQFASQHTLLLSPLYSLAHFAPWNTLLPGIFWSKWSGKE